MLPSHFAWLFILEIQMKVTLNQFAVQVGTSDRVTLDHSTVWHKQYVAMDTQQRKVVRLEFVQGYITGNLKVSAKESDRILSLSRDDRTKEQQQSYLRASGKFNYHISRTEKSGVSKQVDIVAKALALVGEMTPAQKRSFLNKLAK